MSEHGEMKQYIEQRLARGLDTPELDGAEVLSLINDLERVKALNHQQFGDAIRKNAEVESLKKENARLTDEVRGLIESPGDAL